jgi:hypothetical protein
MDMLFGWKPCMKGAMDKSRGGKAKADRQTESGNTSNEKME